MVIDMNDVKLVTLEQLRGFLAGTSDLGLNPTADAVARYGFIKSVLKRFKYPLQSKTHRGLIRRYLQRVTGYSRPQLTRLIAQYLSSGRLVQRHTATATAHGRRVGDVGRRVLLPGIAFHAGVAVRRRAAACGHRRGRRGHLRDRWHGPVARVPQSARR